MVSSAEDQRCVLSSEDPAARYQEQRKTQATSDEAKPEVSLIIFWEHWTGKKKKLTKKSSTEDWGADGHFVSDVLSRISQLYLATLQHF